MHVTLTILIWGLGLFGRLQLVYLRIRRGWKGLWQQAMFIYIPSLSAERSLNKESMFVRPLRVPLRCSQYKQRWAGSVKNLFEREKLWHPKVRTLFVDSSSIRGTWAPPSEATYALIWVVTPLIPANITDVHIMRSMNSSSACFSLLPQLLLTTTSSRQSKQNPFIVSTYLWAVLPVSSKILERFYIKNSNCKILKPWSSQKRNYRNYNIIYSILHVHFMSKNIRADPPTPLMFVSL